MRKLFKLSILSIVFALNENAYKVGDIVSSNIANKLKLGSGITVVDFFASWCVSCKKELPLVNDLSLNSDERKLKIVGVGTDENVEEGIVFQKKLALTFYIYNDKNQSVVSKFNPIGMPAIYYIKDKKILKIRFGAINHINEVIKQDIKDF